MAEKITEEILRRGEFYQDRHADTTWYHPDLPGWVCMQNNNPRWRISMHGDVVQLKNIGQLCALFHVMGHHLPAGWYFLQEPSKPSCTCIVQYPANHDPNCPMYAKRFGDGRLSV